MKTAVELLAKELEDLEESDETKKAVLLARKGALLRKLGEIK